MGEILRPRAFDCGTSDEVLRVGKRGIATGLT